MCLSVLMYVKDLWRRKDIMYEMAGVPSPQEEPSGPPHTSAPHPKEQPRVRVEFPETWLWSESSAGYHLTPDISCATEFTSLGWCF